MNKRDNTGVILGTILVIVFLLAFFIRSNKLESLEKDYEELQEQYDTLLEESTLKQYQLEDLLSGAKVKIRELEMELEESQILINSQED